MIKYEKSNDRYLRELHNLSLLTQIKHPNIVELLCIYSYQDLHTFVFPAADHGDLEKLLEMPERPAQFNADEVFFVSLAELASALDAVHNFFVDMLDIRLTGYHHDLAPRNILVDGSSFLLADFGLSTFKDRTEKSSTSFKNNRGFYIAPECQDLEGKLQTFRINQSSDIWSFGCILMEVFVYMKHGVQGVEEFEEARTYETPEFISRRYHNGPNRSSPAVVRWIEELGINALKHEKRLLHLISTILSIKPQDRPKSGQVLSLVQLVAIEALSKATENEFVENAETGDDLEAFIELKRFRSWAWAFEQTAEPRFRSSDSGAPVDAGDAVGLDFPQIIRLLRNMRELLAITSGKIEGPRNRWHMFRSHNTNLLNTLPKELRSQARSHLEAELLQTQNTDLLQATRAAMERPDGDQMIGVLAAIKSMTIRAEKRSLTCDPKLRIELESIRLEKSVGHHSLAIMDSSMSSHQRVVVEWLKYDAKWSKKDVGEKLFSRIESITEVLSSADQCRLPAVLQSCGFFHDPAQHAFGQVYNLPLSYGQENKAISLREILKDHRSLYCPALQDRFKLAHTLVSAVLIFHKIDWLHRALNASNIIFFPPDQSPPSEQIRDPRIVGFMHSRKNEKTPFTQGPQDGKEFRDYLHPDYLQSGTVLYRPEFDYYSLGILLLEIGIWDSLSNIVASKSFQGLSNHEFRQRLLDRRMPQLRQATGAMYSDATRACLESNFLLPQSTSASGSTSNPALYDAFKRLVVDCIGECKV